MLRISHRRPTRWAGIWRFALRSGTGSILRRRELPGKPFTQTRSTEAVQTVEKRERLVEHLGADLSTVSRRGGSLTEWRIFNILSR